MYDKYFNELDAKKRKRILNKMKPETSQEEAEVSQLHALFDLRYTPDKKGEEYIDNFIDAVVSLKIIIRNRTSKYAVKRTTKTVLESVHTLCLDRTDEFSPELLYRELCQMTALYISLCFDDSHYRSFALGFGRIRDENLGLKIREDLDKIWSTIPDYLEVKDDYLILKRAMDDTLNRALAAIAKKDEDDEDDEDDE